MAIITISRQFGSGGRTLAEKVSKQLGYPLFDNELIQMVAEKARVSEAAVNTLEKDSSSSFQRFFSGILPKNLKDILAERKGESIEEEVYVDILTKIITEIAESGSAVIIGRGSQYILQEAKNAFHILVRANWENRLAFMEKTYDLTRDQAKQSVEQDDRRRANLYRRFGKSDYDSPDLYHLVLNTSRISLEVACRLVCRLVRRNGPEAV